MTLSDDELKLLEEKTEDLITLAVNEGANVDFEGVRNHMEVGKRFRLRKSYSVVQAHLEEGIAAANREQKKRASRRPVIVRFKNLIGLLVG